MPNIADHAHFLHSIEDTAVFQHKETNQVFILGLKPWNRFKAAKAATGSTPCLKPGACAPPSRQAAKVISQNVQSICGAKL